jgi:hypothetical protein
MAQSRVFANSRSVADGVNFSAVRTQSHFFCVLPSLLPADLLGKAIAGDK